MVYGLWQEGERVVLFVVREASRFALLFVVREASRFALLSVVRDASRFASSPPWYRQIFRSKAGTPHGTSHLPVHSDFRTSSFDLE
jgi:hypothetical protein